MTEKERNNLDATLGHTERVAEYIHVFVDDLNRRSREHDRSKFEEPEFSEFARLLPQLEDSSYGSEEYDDLTDELDDPALGHHYAVNDHHPEFYENGLEDMDLFSIVEMVCDWMAACGRHDDGNDIHNSIEFNQQRFGYSDQMKSILHNTAEKLCNET